MVLAEMLFFSTLSADYWRSGFEMLEISILPFTGDGEADLISDSLPANCGRLSFRFEIIRGIDFLSGD